MLTEKSWFMNDPGSNRRTKKGVFSSSPLSHVSKVFFNALMIEWRKTKNHRQRDYWITLLKRELHCLPSTYYRFQVMKKFLSKYHQGCPFSTSMICLQVSLPGKIVIPLSLKCILFACSISFEAYRTSKLR